MIFGFNRRSPVTIRTRTPLRTATSWTFDAVADHHRQLVERKIVHAACVNDSIRIALIIRIISSSRSASWPTSNCPPSVLRQIFQRRQHPPRINQPVRRRKKKFAQLEQRQQPAATPVRVQHRQHADVVLVHQAQRLGGGRVRRHAQDFRLHHVAHLGRNVGDEARRRHAKRSSTKSMRSFVSPQRAATASGMPVRRLNSA